VKRLVQETDLAWALANAASTRQSALTKRSQRFATVQIGCRETNPRRADLVQRYTTWLDAYVGHEQERYLRRLIEDFVTPYRIQVPPTVGITPRRWSTRPG
jgi:hypothetical protein